MRPRTNGSEVSLTHVPADLLTPEVNFRRSSTVEILPEDATVYEWTSKLAGIRRPKPRKGKVPTAHAQPLRAGVRFDAKRF